MDIARKLYTQATGPYKNWKASRSKQNPAPTEIDAFIGKDNQVAPPQGTSIENLPPGAALSIVLLGKTGHGKSATANSIFGEKRFESQMSSTSVTTQCKMEHGLIGDREIFLVDTPGTMDTKDPDSALLEISHAITLRPEGFHAFLLVLNVSVRMTNEEKMAVILLKKMFGEDILMKYTVLVFTHGDDFIRQKTESFGDYISSQGGELGQLVKECSSRCVLINNMERDPGKLRQQVIELINVVDTVVSENEGKMYTNHLFEFARARIDEEMKKYQDMFANTLANKYDQKNLKRLTRCKKRKRKEKNKMERSRN